MFVLFSCGACGVTVLVDTHKLWLWSWQPGVFAPRTCALQCGGSCCHCFREVTGGCASFLRYLHTLTWRWLEIPCGNGITDNWATSVVHSVCWVTGDFSLTACPCRTEILVRALFFRALLHLKELYYGGFEHYKIGFCLAPHKPSPWSIIAREPSALLPQNGPQYVLV